MDELDKTWWISSWNLFCFRSALVLLQDEQRDFDNRRHGSDSWRCRTGYWRHKRSHSRHQQGSWISGSQHRRKTCPGSYDKVKGIYKWRHVGDWEGSFWRKRQYGNDWEKGLLLLSNTKWRTDLGTLVVLLDQTFHPLYTFTFIYRDYNLLLDCWCLKQHKSISKHFWMLFLKCFL